MKIQVKQNLFLFLFCAQCLPVITHAYDFAVMPVRSLAQTEESFRPLMSYLSKVSGEPIKLKAYSNFVDYWQDMRADKFDFALDAAHFVDYRVKKQEHQVLAKIKDKVSFSLVTTQDFGALDSTDLIGKPIACLPPPSRGNLQIDSFYKNPIRQPRKIEVKSYEEAVAKMLSGKVKGAILPTSMIGAYPNLNVVEATALWPHMGFTASPNVPTQVKSAVTKALLSLTRDKKGAEALTASGLTGFRPADNSVYDGYSRYLKTYTRFD